MDLFGLMDVLASVESCKVWLRENGLIVTPGIGLRCVTCGHHFTEINHGQSGDGSRLRCVTCRRDRSIRAGSFFSRSRLGLRVLVALLFLFAYHAPASFVQTVLGQHVSRRSLLDWFSYFRDICSRWLLDHPVQLGGPGCIVEIEECLLKGNRKPKRPRASSGQWIFGAWDRRLAKGIILTIPSRDRAVLLPLIKRYILPGTHIYSDAAPMYATLEQEGYHQDILARDIDFVTFNAYGVEVHTNGVRGWWGNFKTEWKRMRGTLKHMVPQHLDEIMYRQHRPGEDGDIFDCMIKDIAEYYPALNELD